MRYRLTVIASRGCTDGTERQWEGYGGGGEDRKTCYVALKLYEVDLLHEAQTNTQMKGQ